MSYTYVTGDGWVVLLPAEPDGATEAVAILDNAVRQIKAFINDETSGLGKILGSTGQIKTLVIGTALPTPDAADRYWFYSTSLNGLYFCSSGSFLPVFPTGGGALGKIIKGAGTGVLPTWSQDIPTRATIESHTTLTPNVSNHQMTLTGSGLPTGISISSGRIRVATGYTVLIRGIAHGIVHDAIAVTNATFELYNYTTSTSVQMGCGPTPLTTGYTYFANFDVVFTNSSGANADLGVRVSSANALASTASSTYPNARLIVEVHPN
jgi:hypothetical protein